MRKAYELIGLPVIERITGKRLGKVRDLIINRHWAAEGLLVEYKMWFSPARYIPWEQVGVFGDDAIMVNERTAVQRYEAEPDHYFLVIGKNKVKGLPLVTEEGVHLGHVEDVYFSKNMEKRIIAYELSDGFLNDWIEGRKRLPIPVGAEKGEDIILVPVHHLEEASEIMEKE